MMASWRRTGVEGNIFAATTAADKARGLSDGTGLDYKAGFPISFTRCPVCRYPMRWVKRYTKPNKWGVRNKLLSSRVCHQCGAVTDESSSW